MARSAKCFICGREDFRANMVKVREPWRVKYASKVWVHRKCELRSLGRKICPHCTGSGEVDGDKPPLPGPEDTIGDV